MAVRRMPADEARLLDGSPRVLHLEALRSSAVSHRRTHRMRACGQTRGVKPCLQRTQECQFGRRIQGALVFACPGTLKNVHDEDLATKPNPVEA
jgi:hypothetical protein